MAITSPVILRPDRSIRYAIQALDGGPPIKSQYDEAGRSPPYNPTSAFLSLFPCPFFPPRPDKNTQLRQTDKKRKPDNRGSDRKDNPFDGLHYSDYDPQVPWHIVQHEAEEVGDAGSGRHSAEGTEHQRRQLQGVVPSGEHPSGKNGADNQRDEAGSVEHERNPGEASSGLVAEPESGSQKVDDYAAVDDEAAGKVDFHRPPAAPGNAAGGEGRRGSYDEGRRPHPCGVRGQKAAHETGGGRAHRPVNGAEEDAGQRGERGGERESPSGAEHGHGGDKLGRCGYGRPHRYKRDVRPWRGKPPGPCDAFVHFVAPCGNHTGMKGRGIRRDLWFFRMDRGIPVNESVFCGNRNRKPNFRFH